MKDRTVERSRGCFNCLHFVTGEPAERRFHEKTGLSSSDLGLVAISNLSRNPGTRAKVDQWRRLGFSEYASLDRVLRNEIESLGKKYGMAPKVFQGIKLGEIGYCGVGAVEADFIGKAELCGNSSGQPCRWTGKSGFSASGSAAGRAGMPIDELRDVVDHDAKLRTRGDKK